MNNSHPVTPILWPLHPDRLQIAESLRTQTAEQHVATRISVLQDPCQSCDCWSLWVFSDGAGGQVAACIQSECRDSPLNAFMDGHH